MSISEPQGAFSQYLERVRVSTHTGAKEAAERFVGRAAQQRGHTVDRSAACGRGREERACGRGQIFETLGIKYHGPGGRA